MSPLVIAVVLGAAVAHASWNALLKSGADRFWWMTALCTVQGTIAAVVLCFLPLPSPLSWPYVGASAVIHLGYQLLLVRAYTVGEFGQAYPIARGSSPLLVALGGLLFAGETLTLARTAGILLVSGGIIALAFENRRFAFDRVPVALMTGVSIALYTIVDALGARASGNAVSYIAAMSVIWTGLTLITYLVVRGPRITASSRDVVTAGIGGAVALTGYSAVIWATTVTTMGPVSALRETSVIFAVFLGRVFLRERLSVGRLAPCLIIAAGAVLLA